MPGSTLDPLAQSKEAGIPPTRKALREPNGLLAAGGDLSPERLLTAYEKGIFPWFNEGEPILWWTPAPRAVLFPDQLRVSRSLRKLVRQERFRISVDMAFPEVICNCASIPRQDQSGTWITGEMQLAYIELHRLGFAHSVECWHDENLVGGVYGLALGRVFFGESMFSCMSSASKVALVHLCRRLNALGYSFMDCQLMTPHLRSLGATAISRAEFETLLLAHARKIPRKWSLPDQYC